MVAAECGFVKSYAGISCRIAPADMCLSQMSEAAEGLCWCCGQATITADDKDLSEKQHRYVAPRLDVGRRMLPHSQPR